MPRDWSEVVARFRGARQTSWGAQSWTAFCPYHKGGGERRPSLRIWVAPSGNLWVRCFVCGDEAKKEILQSVGLRVRDLFGEDDGKDDDWHKRPDVKPKVVAKYDYADEDGRVLYQQWRYEPKGFCIHRVENGVAKAGLLTTRRVVYRIPDLLGRPNAAVVCVVEGEKKADLLWGWGIPATTCLGGWGMGWGKGDYSAWLVKSFPKAGFIVLPDNDTPGREFAHVVVGSLLYARAYGIGILELPGLPEKGDVCDFAAAGGTKEDFVRLCNNAPKWKRS